MGKKSRRPTRQQKKLTLDHLDDDTAKPAPPMTVAEIYKSHFIAGGGDPSRHDDDQMIAAFEALPAKEKKAYAVMAKEKRVLFDRRVAFCAKSGPDLVGELFLEVTPFVGVIGSLKLPGVEVRVVGLNHTIWEASHRDKDVRVYEVVDEGETRPKELISLRELRARACGDARAARKAARRSYEFVSEDGFDWETGTRIANGRVISSDDYREITRVSNEVGLAPTDAYYKIVLPRLATEGVKGALKAIKKWPRVRPYWKRVRRRICFNCAKQVAPSEPCYMVCSGCGDARYCSEECQRRDWRAAHQKVCPAGRPG
jgi:hypothetical protein